MGPWSRLNKGEIPVSTTVSFVHYNKYGSTVIVLL